MRILDLDPDRSWRDNAAQDRNAGSRAPQQRMRGYINGSIAATGWALGMSPHPPIATVLTAPRAGLSPTNSADGQGQPMAAHEKVVVTGLGRFGTAVALGPARRSSDVLAIDIDIEHSVQQHSDYLLQVLSEDGTDTAVLQKLGVASAGHAVVAVDCALEAGMLCALALAEPKVPSIWASAPRSGPAQTLRCPGAQRILMPIHDVVQQEIQHLDSQRHWWIRHSENDFAAAAGRITPQIAAIHTETGLTHGAVLAAKPREGHTRLAARRCSATVGHHCDRRPCGLLQHLMSGGER